MFTEQYVYCFDSANVAQKSKKANFITFLIWTSYALGLSTNVHKQKATPNGVALFCMPVEAYWRFSRILAFLPVRPLK